MQLSALVVAPSLLTVTAVVSDWISLTKLPRGVASYSELWLIEKMTHDDAACFCLAVALDGLLIAGKVAAWHAMHVGELQLCQEPGMYHLTNGEIALCRRCIPRADGLQIASKRRRMRWVLSGNLTLVGAWL